jgi:hypothetical protein
MCQTARHTLDQVNIRAIGVEMPKNAAHALGFPILVFRGLNNHPLV